MGQSDTASGSLTGTAILAERGSLEVPPAPVVPPLLRSLEDAGDDAILVCLCSVERAWAGFDAKHGQQPCFREVGIMCAPLINDTWRPKDSDKGDPKRFLKTTKNS